MEFMKRIWKSEDIEKLNKEFQSIDRMIWYDKEKSYKKSIIFQRLLILEKMEAILAWKKEVIIWKKEDWNMFIHYNTNFDEIPKEAKSSTTTFLTDEEIEYTKTCDIGNLNNILYKYI